MTGAAEAFLEGPDGRSRSALLPRLFTPKDATQLRTALSLDNLHATMFLFATILQLSAAKH